MPRIRSEQIQDLTIRDINLAPDANIDQSKIESWESDLEGWLSRGIIKAVPMEFFTDGGQQTFAEFWDGSQAGQLYFNTATDELFIGTSASPFYNLVAGYGTDGVNGHDRDIVVQMGTEATDYGGPGENLATTFNLGVDLATDGSNFDLYLNGSLMQESTDGDFQIVGPQTIQFNFDVYGEDKITAIIVTDANFSNYTTKAYLDNLFYGESGHSHDGVDSMQLNFNEAMEQSEIEALTRALHLGTADLSSGFDWGTTPQDFGFNPNSTGTVTIALDAATTSPLEVATLINSKFTTGGITGFEAYVDGNSVGIRALASGGSYSFILTAGTEDALVTLGLTAGQYSGTSRMGILINHTLYPTTDTRNLGDPTHPWGNVYANEGHFSASSIWIDNAKLQFNTTDGSLEVSEDGGATFAKVAKRATEAEPAIMDAGVGQKVVLESDTGIEIIGNILPDTASLRNIGSQTLPFDSIYADEIFLSGSSLYVNGKKVLADESDTMTFTTDPNQAMMIKTLDDAGSRGNANISMISANNYNVNSVGDMTFTVNASLTDKDIAFVNNSSNGAITFNANGNSLITYSNIEPGTNGDLHIGSGTKAFNDAYVNTIYFRPLAEAGDFAKIDSVVSGTNTLVKHQIGANSSDAIVFQGNNGTTVSDLLIISGDGKVTISGDLVVNGTTTTVNSTQTNISDSNFTIKTAETPVDGSASFEVQRASGNAKLQWNDTDDVWEIHEGSDGLTVGQVSNPKKIDGVTFHADEVAPTATTRLNMDGYFYATRVYNAVYNDLAEFMPKAAESQPGDVLVMTEQGLMPSTQRLDGAVVGVHSDSFGYALGADDAENKLPVAISGRVWVRLSEPCKIGDLLVSGDMGRASVVKPGEDVLGKVLGKVLQNKENFKEERVEMLVMNS